MSTAPLSSIFNWSTFTGGDQFEIIGDLAADIDLDDVGIAEFQIKALNDVGNSIFNTSFNVINAGVGCADSDSNPGNNANLSYTMVNPLAITCQDATIYLDASGMAELDENDLVNTFMDMTGTGVFSFDPASPFSCQEVGSEIIVTVTLTDDLGNMESCPATVTVEDNLSATATCPSAIEVCRDALPLNLSTPSGGTFSRTGVTGNSYNAGDGTTNTVTYSYTDPGTGCESSCTFDVTVCRTGNHRSL